MKDPTPWLDPTELERQLLDAARQDTAPATLKLRMAEALAASQPLAATQSAAQGSGTGLTRGGAWFSQPAIWGSLSALIVVAAVSWRVVSHSEPSGARIRAAMPAQLTAAATARVESSPDEQSNSVQASGPALAPAAPALTTPTVNPSAAADRASEPRAGAGIRGELELLDAARAALASRETSKALQLLDQHAERFARGRLAPEADGLRIDALMQRGAFDRARRLSRRFLERHPTHPLAAHISELAQVR